MSRRRLTRIGWLLVAVSVTSIAVLAWVSAQQIDQWDALPLALLLHLAMASAMVAHGLCWRRGGAPLQSTAQLCVVGVTLYWMYTWFVPLQELTAWARVFWYGWLHG